MPNIIINNYCNQKCKYCFAEDNMTSIVKKDMKTSTFIKILKYLKHNNDFNVRILGWEPLLSLSIRNFLLLSIKWWFNVIIFSNINIPNEKLKSIFSWIEIKDKLRINCNINNLDFYKQWEVENINKNLFYLNNIWVKLILGYNIYDLDKDSEFIFNLAKKHNIGSINLKITNSSLWEKLIIDNSKKELWSYIFNLIKKYYKDFFIEISCWLDKDIFTYEQINFISHFTKIKLRFWCDWNIWEFDINSDWSIFKCFPLYNLYKKNTHNIDYLINNNIWVKSNIEYLKNNFWKVISKWECTANKKIKCN